MKLDSLPSTQAEIKTSSVQPMASKNLYPRKYVKLDKSQTSLNERTLRERIFLYHNSSERFPQFNGDWFWNIMITGCYVLKRAFDVVITFALIVALAPVFLLVIVLIRLESYGCAFYGEKRVGRDGEIFRLYQFRILHARVPQYNFLRFFVKDDAGAKHTLLHVNENRNFTRVGKVLYLWHLDKLPELFNILLGDMALLGPRPWKEHEVRSYSLSRRAQLHLKPGLAFLGNSEATLDFQDMEYLSKLDWARHTFVLLKISLFVFFGRAAY